MEESRLMPLKPSQNSQAPSDQKFTSLQPSKVNGISSLLQTGMGNVDLSWLPFIVIGIVLSLGAALAINFTTSLPQIIILGGVIGLFIAFIIFQNPEVGAYLLIFTVFTNLSDLFTEKGLPSINKPFIAIAFFSIVVHYLFRTEKRLKLPQITRIEMALLAYFGIIVASIFVASDQSLARAGFLDLMKDVAVGLCIVITLNTKPKLKNGIYVLILAVSFVSLLGIVKTISGTEQTFWGFAQNSAFGQANDSGILRYGGPIGESNVWAQVLAATLPLVIYQFAKRTEPFIKIIMLLSGALIFLALLFTQSRGAILALFLVLPLIAWEMRIKASTLLLVSTLGLAVLFLVPAQYTERIRTLQIFFQTDQEYGFTQDEAAAGRREKMLTGLAMFRDKPFLGVGFANYNTNYWEYAGQLGLESDATDIQSEKGAREPHSLYIEIMSETGLLGILTFLAFFGLLFGGLYQARKALLTGPDKRWAIWVTAIAFAILSFLLSGFFLHGIQFRYIWVLIGLALASIYVSKRIAYPNRNEETAT